jgi:lipid-A-disaccharide synthase
VTASHIFLIAGEPSGDALGARLMAALKRITGGAVRFSGVGGDLMIAEGLTPLFPMAELAHFGLLEVLPHLRALKSRIDETVGAVVAGRPDALVTIDSPGFTVRVARAVKERAPGVALVHYVAPTVWAWKPERAAKFAKVFDRLLAVLPFEPPYFEREGLPCTFVGHSVVEGGAGKGDGAAFRTRHGLGGESELVCVLPGSRRGEVARLLPVFGATVARLKERHPGLVAIVPTVSTVRERVRETVSAWPMRTLVVEGEGEKHDAFAASAAALAASGTVALELALAGLPSVIGYRVHPVTAAIARRLIKVRYVNLVNLMLDRMLVPELLQGDCRPDRLADAMERLLSVPEARREQIDGVADVARWLGRGGVPPAERAARAVLDSVAAKRGPSLGDER